MTVTDEPSPRSSETRLHIPPATVTVTCTIDHHAHEVPDVELAAASSRPGGLVRAICGQAIAPGPMVAPDGPPCLLCTAIDDVQRERR
ncbi:hypothetical protein [Pseudonocardia cypriaca]|uniref:hypothetical protein n=1 Tax=Pseudonocardia cypriaca TaxID=882449 RepID=UPI001476BE5C|nr:hypothetical protein [Pseudonocardia cypriaca]